MVQQEVSGEGIEMPPLIIVVCFVGLKILVNLIAGYLNDRTK